MEDPFIKEFSTQLLEELGDEKVDFLYGLEPHDLDVLRGYYREPIPVLQAMLDRKQKVLQNEYADHITHMSKDAKKELEDNPTYKSVKSFKPKDSSQELEEYFTKHTSFKAPKVNDNVIMLKDPEDYDLFIETLTNNRYKTNIIDNDKDVYRTVYMNKLPNLEAVMTNIDHIYDTETRKPFKLTFRFGYVIEKRVSGDIEYEVIHPHYSEDHQVITLGIKDRKSLNDFKQYLLHFISDYIQNVTIRASADRHICFHAILP
jgi:RNA binding exosome subunit